jgi:hypothetical protein
VFSRLLLIVYFIEAGLLLLVVPWKPFWEHNRFVQAWDWSSALAQTGYVRGAVSGVGVLLLLAGLVELASLFIRRREA